MTQRNGFGIRGPWPGFVVVFLGLILCQSCQGKHPSAPNEFQKFDAMFSPYAGADKLENLFQTACENKSSNPSYLVIRVENQKTRQTKEICCESTWLRQAMHIENQLGYEIDEVTTADCMILDNYPRIFSFKSEEALEILHFFQYPGIAEIMKTAEAMNLDGYQKKYGRNDQLVDFTFHRDQLYEKLTMAHILFKTGILTQKGGDKGERLCLGHPGEKNPFYEDDKRYHAWRSSIISIQNSNPPLPPPAIK